jgi:hypothetical protein
MARCGGSGIVATMLGGLGVASSVGGDIFGRWVPEGDRFSAGIGEFPNAEVIVDALRVPAAATLSVPSVMRASWICRF